MFHFNTGTPPGILLKRGSRTLSTRHVWRRAGATGQRALTSDACDI